jgi:isocitrate dehydrogenase kinase/phosphatase
VGSYLQDLEKAVKDYPRKHSGDGMTDTAFYAVLSGTAATKIHQAYDDYQATFRRITQRAKTRFEDCDWHGVQADAVERLELYKIIIDQIVTDIETILGENICNRSLWNRMKSDYSYLIAQCTDYDLQETF